MGDLLNMSETVHPVCEYYFVSLGKFILEMHAVRRINRLRTKLVVVIHEVKVLVSLSL